MLPQDKLKVIDQGTGYVISEVAGRMPLPYLKETALVAQFDGVDTCLDFVTKNMPDPKREGSSTDRGRGSFNAFASYDEAITTFRSNPESVVRFDPSELRIKDESEAGSTVDYDVTGDYIDMGRFMEGIPESVGTMHSGNARNRRVNLTINLNQWWGMEHETITHWGERILRLVDALEGGGIRTQLTGILSNETMHTEVRIKQHDEPLTISDLAVVTHPEFLRRIGFRIAEHSKTWQYGYGSAKSFGRSASPEIIRGDNVNEMNIFIDSNMDDKRDIDRRFDEVERLLVWEMSKPIPEVDSIKVDSYTVYFQANGARPEAEVQQEGKDAIKAE